MRPTQSRELPQPPSSRISLYVGKSHYPMVSSMASEVVKVDGKGRVLIPEGIRDSGGIEPGAPLQVTDLGKGILVLRRLELPSREGILKICRETRRELFKERVEPWLKGTGSRR